MMGWTQKNYAVFRMILGGYLAIHFAALLPWAAELFSDGGMMVASLSPLIGIFPNPLGWVGSPLFATAFVGSGVVLSAMLAGGVRDRIAALVLWFIWASLLGRAPLISNPGIPFVGWLLLMHAAVPVPRTRDEEWRLPRPFYTLAWVIMAAGYTYSGVTKLGSPSWIDGSALWYVLESPLARGNFLREWLVSVPALLKAATYGVLALEVLFAPLAAFPRLRPMIWLAMVAMHLGIIATVDFADLTVGMLMIHVITFDPDWLRLVREKVNSWRGRRAQGTQTRSIGVV